MTHRCRGIHCVGCRSADGNGPGRVIAVIAVVVVIIIAAGVRAHGHAIADAFETGGLVLCGLAVTGGAALTAWRIRQGRQARAARISPRVRAVITDVRAGRSAAEAAAAQAGVGTGADTGPKARPDAIHLTDDAWALLEGRRRGDASHGGDR